MGQTIFAEGRFALFRFWTGRLFCVLPIGEGPSHFSGELFAQIRGKDVEAGADGLAHCGVEFFDEAGRRPCEVGIGLRPELIEFFRSEHVQISGS